MADNPIMRALAPDENADAPPLGGSRREAVQRLQIGLSGILAMVLLVGLVDVIRQQADETEETAVPEAAATVQPSATVPAKNDPLAQAGVVPDLPAEPTPKASQRQGGPIAPGAEEAGPPRDLDQGE
ncbi:hypothetical protein [Qipengyuania sp. JC766]|uniref:hypothetical protein n=1 Tax=Qipengyuania sp. JC766 TaxID=3232139 RepID=UPI0034575029